jgi:MOSC domain-containing protein YiiM
MAGRLEAIWIKRAHRGPMDAVERATVRAGRGLVGNADQGRWRQVTMIDQRAWDEAIEAVGVAALPVLRRANFLLIGIALARSRGRILRVGACHFKINGETRPCERMDEAEPGLQAALRVEWRGGAYAAALDDGQVLVGDSVEWVEQTTGG